MPDAATITVKETLDLFDGPFAAVGKGVAQGSYAFWLGSGISRDRVVGLDGVLSKLIEFLRSRATPDPDCSYRNALDKIISMASPSQQERNEIDLSQPAETWPCLRSLLERLWNQYSAVLSVELPDEKLDYLLWVGLDFANTFSSQHPDPRRLLKRTHLCSRKRIPSVHTSVWAKRNRTA